MGLFPIIGMHYFKLEKGSLKTGYQKALFLKYGSLSEINRDLEAKKFQRFDLFLGEKILCS